MYYRLDGSPYEGPDNEVTLQWARDFADTSGRIVRQEMLWNGVYLSTVWLGLDHNFSMDPDAVPLIFETMSFDQLTGEDEESIQYRWSTLEQATFGHQWARRQVAGLLATVRRWWHMSKVVEEESE